MVTNLGTAGIGYINGDLTVALTRLPQDDWVGVEAETHWADRGIAVGATTLYDSAGFPVELSTEEARARGIELSPDWRAEFDARMAEQRARSQAARRH